MKAIIPVAGAGTKLRPLTYTQPKPLIPVAGKPIIAYILDQLIEAGIREYVFILGYLGEKIREYLDENYRNITRHYVSQNEREGLGHAIFLCKDILKNEEEVLIQLGDTILDIDMNVLQNSKVNTLAVRKVDDPRNFGVVELNEKGLVERLVEKPQFPRSNLAIVGLYHIKEWQKLLSCLESNIQSGRKTKGEFHLTDGLMCMIEYKSKFEIMEVRNWFDCGKKEILLSTNAIMLARKPQRQLAYNHENNIFIPPVSIGNNCQITHSIIGPNVSIGDNSQITNSILKDGIIGNFTSLEDVVLQHSIIGNDAVIKGRVQSFNIGDNTEIDMI
ncbi:MAG: NTP transferase domain-containing protein [Saprospiraceae bacterium]|nr:NTP transferase domain-containing protein [Saprospiraceae bacterium]